jgi:HCOMODA/2-hydroxy-3-carboxy-muconic semialdehyde decarboxylase
MSLLEDPVISYRTLADHGVIDAYGHVSVRSGRDPNRYLMARAVAPELVTEDDILEFDLDSNPIAAGGRALYNERFIHGEIYKLRPEVQAVVHNHSPSVIPFSCTGCQLRPIFHMSAFIGLGVPTWDIREVQEGSDLLVRTTELGRALAHRLSYHPAALMRGHGSVVVGEDLPRAVGRSVYLEQNARMQLQAMLIAGPRGEVIYMDEKEVVANVAWQKYARSWDLWQTTWRRRLAAEREASRHPVRST